MKNATQLFNNNNKKKNNNPILQSIKIAFMNETNTILPNIDTIPEISKS